MSSSAESAPEQPPVAANEVAEGLGKFVTSETDTAVSLEINESSLASPSQARLVKVTMICEWDDHSVNPNFAGFVRLWDVTGKPISVGIPQYAKIERA